MPVDDQLIANIYCRMAKAGMGKNISALAAASGMQRSAVSRLLHGHQESVNLETIKKIAAGLGCTPSTLLRGVV